MGNKHSKREKNKKDSQTNNDVNINNNNDKIKNINNNENKNDIDNDIIKVSNDNKDNNNDNKDNSKDNNIIEERVCKSFKGIELYDIIQSNHIQDSWNLFTKHDMMDTTKLEDHCDEDRYYAKFVFSHSKVLLNNGKYLNANYVLQKQYIASQAPLQKTIPIFWEMIYTENVSLIIMLTNLIEGNKRKAVRYWPTTNHSVRHYTKNDNDDNDDNDNTDDTITKDEGKWQLELLDKCVFEDNILKRDLKLSYISNNEDNNNINNEDNIKEQRKITQLHYIGWPDHGCPSEIPEVLALLYGVYLYSKNNTNPIVIHCSAGIGRTGTFITIHYELIKLVSRFQEQDDFNSYKDYDNTEKITLIQDFICEHIFSIDNTVKELRKDRKMMVQREEQLVFCYEVFSYLIDTAEDYLYDDFLIPIFFSL